MVVWGRFYVDGMWGTVSLKYVYTKTPHLICTIFVYIIRSDRWILVLRFHEDSILITSKFSRNVPPRHFKTIIIHIELLKRKEVSATLCVLYNAHDLLDGERICPQNYIHCRWIRKENKTISFPDFLPLIRVTCDSYKTVKCILK